MTINCSAIYENGVLRLKQPLALREGTEVDVIVLGKDKVVDECTVKTIFEIAATPLETDDQGFSGRDHDSVLYGKR